MLALDALVVLVGFAGPVDTPRHTWPAPAGIQQPPDRWAKRPAVVVKTVRDDDARKKCMSLIKGSAPHEVWGCAVTSKKPCLIILQSGMPPDLEDAVLKHEIGHCKGWPPGHPLK